MDLKQAWAVLTTLQLTFVISFEVIENELSNNIEIITDDLLQGQNQEIKADLKQRDNHQYFVMWRSGIFLLVNVTHVAISRVYEEVPHKGDNEYFLQNSDGAEHLENSQVQFRRITNKYCRTPIPDRYFIIMRSFRNRFTMAYLDSNSTNKTQLWKPVARGLHNLKRTLNKKCSRNTAAILTDNYKASESFYCTKDSPLLNKIFGQYVEESIFIKKPRDCSNFQHACQQCFEQANASRKLDQQTLCEGSREECMKFINCYNTPGCLGFYSPPCYPEYQANNFANGTCVKGNTFKLSLSPDFHNISNAFQCHLQRSKFHEFYINFTIQVGLSQMGENNSGFDFSQILWKTHPQELHLKVNDGNLNTVAGLLNVFALLRSSNFSMYSPKEAILRGMKSIENDYDYDIKLYNLKAFHKLKEPTQEEHSTEVQNQGDLQIKAVQFSRPFLYSTSNWRTSGCDMDISSIISGDGVLYGSVISSALQIIDTKGNPENFYYVIKEDTENTLKVKFELKEATSVLKYATCNKTASANDKSIVRTAKPSLQFSNQRWILNINGRTEVVPLYLNVRVAFDESFTNPIANQDLLIFPRHVKKSTDVSFQTTYKYSIHLRLPHLSTHLVDKGPFKQDLKILSVIIQDCIKSQKVQLLIFPSNEPIDTMMLDGVDASDLKNGGLGNLSKPTTPSTIFSMMFPAKNMTIVPYLVLFIAALIIIVILIVLSVLNCIIKRKRRSRIHGIHLKTLYLKDAENLKFITLTGEKPEPQEGHYIPLNSKSRYLLFKQPDFRKQGFSCAKKGILVSYVSFRVFYTFIFTFSVALSVLFSFWPPAGFDGNSGANQEVLYPMVQREAARREIDTEKTLLQHSNKAAQLVRACQDIMIRQVVDVARGVDQAVQEVLDAELNPHKYKDNMFNTMESLVLHQMAELNYSVQDYISHLLVELNNATMSDALRFSDLLSRIYASQWLLFVKRMTNNTHVPWNINAPQAQFLPTQEYLNELRLKISNIQFARQFGLAEAENFLFIPMLITSQLEDLVLSQDPSKTLKPKFISSVYKDVETSTQSNSGQGYEADQDVFKPLVHRSFTNMDDLDILSHQNRFNSKSKFKPLGDRKSTTGLFGIHLLPLSLGQIRLTLFLIDCYLIAARFYNTYLVLSEILTDKRVIVDAASYISLLAAQPVQKHLNGVIKLDGSQYSSFNEEMHYQCRHSSEYKPDTDDTFERHQRYQPSSPNFIRPIKSVQEVGGSSASYLQMSFARTNRFIIIFFIWATVLFLSFFVLSVDHQFLRTTKNAISGREDSSRADKTSLTDYYKRSEILIRNHVENLNGAFLSLTRLNENRLRKRMYRFAERFKHDLQYVEYQFQTEICQISKLVKIYQGPQEAKNSPPIPLSCTAPPIRLVDVDVLFQHELCQFLPLKPSNLRRFLDRPIKNQSWKAEKASTITYLWRAVANWIGGVSVVSPLAVSHFLAIALCISVGMYGLMSVFQAFGSLCLQLNPGEPCLGESNVYLISAVPPPIERRFRPLTPVQTSRIFSVSDSVNPPSPLSFPLSSSNNIPLEDIKFVETTAFVSDGTQSTTQQQYVLLSNSIHQSEGTAFVLSTEPSQRICTGNPEYADA